MKLMTAGAAGWIGFYIAGQILYGGRIVPMLPKLAHEIATSRTAP
jgi:hypothetical protein